MFVDWVVWGVIKVTYFVKNGKIKNITKVLTLMLFLTQKRIPTTWENTHSQGMCFQ